MRTRLLPMLLALLALCSCLVFADGCYVPKIAPGTEAQDITEPTQKAVIVHFQGKELLVLQVSFKGSVSEFAWLIPTPARPELKRDDRYNSPLYHYDFGSGSNTFHRLHYATAPRISYWFEADRLIRDSIMRSVRARWQGGDRVRVTPGVDVLERRIVGNYDVAALRAASEVDLLNWLRANGYHVSPKLAPVFADYIRRGWFFTAARINAGDKRTRKRLREGSLEALKLQFQSRQPVYPLKISSLNPGRTNILLYVVADHFVTGSGFRTLCGFDSHTRTDDMGRAVGLARMFTFDLTGSLPDPETDPKGFAKQPRCCLTKLTADLEPRQMTTDLVLTPSRSQTGFASPHISPPLLENLGAVVLLPVVFLLSLPICLLPASVCLLLFALRPTPLNIPARWIAGFLVVAAWMTWFCIVAGPSRSLFNVLAAVAFLGLLLLVIRGGGYHGIAWLIAGLIILAAWLPIFFMRHALEDSGYWPVGLAVVIGVPLVAGLLVRRAWVRRKTVAE